MAAAGIEFSSFDLTRLADTWRGSTPFPHIVIDDAVSAETLDALRVGVSKEPHWPEQSEIVEAMASGPDLQQEALRAYAAALTAPANLDAIRRFTGIEVSTVDVRSYVYLAGGYLLPHADYQASLDRKIAWVHYLSHDGTCTGGELELFRCTTDQCGEIVATESARLIEHKANRLVMFAVSTISLHQVREIAAGARVSLAGWFH